MIFTNSIDGFDGAQELLIKLVEQSPDDWETRKRVVQVLYDEGLYSEAAKLVWAAPEIPPVTEEVVFTTRVVAMGQPARAVKLVAKMIESNQDNAKECLNIAKALLREGLALQALRFYGAATVKDVTLVDEAFELSLVNADCSDDHWEDLVEEEGFPWDGPRDMSLSSQMSGGTDEEGSAAEVLLKSVTQRVPLKAPVKDVSEESGSDTATSLPNEPARDVKPMLSPTAEKLAKQAGDSSPKKSKEGESFTSLVNFFKHKEEEQGQDLDTEDQQPTRSQPLATATKQPTKSKPVAAATKQPVKSQPLATAATSVDVSSHTNLDTRAELPPAPSSPLVQGGKPRPSEAPTKKAPEAAVKPAKEKAVEPVKQQKKENLTGKGPEAKKAPAAQAAPKSVIDPKPASEQAAGPFAHTPANIAPPEPAVVAAAAASPALPPLTPVVEEAAEVLAGVEPASRPEVNRNADQKEVSQVIAQAAEFEGLPAIDEVPVAKEESEQAEVKEDVSDMVANALAERQSEQPKTKRGGFFSSLMGIFKRSKSPRKSSGSKASAAKASVSKATENSEPEKAEPVAAEPVLAVGTPVATTVLRKPKTDGYEPPRELDGRTQLVALAPQDGNVFFEKLADKYNSMDPTQLPPAAVVARDMANVDYLKLINEACAKDLTAFSKLLGLHSVMTKADCASWVEDMDLLRKGYGDAVLATVVSKYSVAECREILGAVYQRPSAQAAS